VAFQAETASDGKTLAKVAIALGSVAPTPIRVADAEAVLKGLSVDEALAKIGQSAKIAARAAKPIDDVRASASYRRAIIAVFLQQCAQKALGALKNNGGN
jgi:carbon-monoxide dehydrogenase medium subunit